jgi:hypothetical protein
MMADMDRGIIARIERKAGLPGLADALAGLAPTDLQSLLLSVYARQAAALTPAAVLRRYETDRFASPAAADPRALAAFDVRAGELLGALGYAGVELSPVAPLGTASVLGPVDQNNVMTTIRTSEVVSDPTNSLALECAVRRRARLRADPRDAQPVRLYASHRLVRTQLFTGPRQYPHFRLLALTTAGRDIGAFGFETTSLAEQLDTLIRLAAPVPPGDALALRVTVTDLSGGVRREALHDRVIVPLRQRYPLMNIGFDDARASGRGYYLDACFHVHRLIDDGRDEIQIADGGFTTWTRDLLGNAKERLLTGCLAAERVLA